MNHPAHPRVAETQNGRRAVVYIDEAVLGRDELDVALGRILAGGPDANRYIVRVRTRETLQRLLDPPFDMLPIEKLVGGELELPEGACGVIHFSLAAAGLDDGRQSREMGLLSLNADIENFGLALSDAVLESTRAEGDMLLAMARRLGKPLLPLDAVASPAPQAHAESWPVVESVIDSLAALDPAEGKGLRGFWRRRFGRFDAGVTDLMAAGGMLAGAITSGAAPGKALTHIRKSADALLGWSIGRPWPTSAYFAPDDWLSKCPSHPVANEGEIVRAFDWLDRAARSGARQYRDLMWLVYMMAFWAVFAAVGGVVWEEAGAVVTGLLAWSEIVALTSIAGVVVWLHSMRLQHRWTACRIGAEQLRVARMSLPLMIVPPALLSADPNPAEPGVTTGPTPPPDRTGPLIWLQSCWKRLFRRRHLGINEAAVVIALVKRAIRDQGPSALKPGTTVRDAAIWVRCIVTDQFNYHHGNHHRLHAVETAVRTVNLIIFSTAILVVAFHLLHIHIEGALLFTAAGPALAAALHGATSRMEIPRRIDLSHAYANKLQEFEGRLDTIIASESGSWTELREVVIGAIEAMGSEADAWHATMLLDPVALP